MYLDLLYAKNLYGDYRSTLYRYAFEIEKNLRDMAQTHIILHTILQSFGNLHGIDLIDPLLERVFKKENDILTRTRILILRCIALGSHNTILLDYVTRLTP